MLRTTQQVVNSSRPANRLDARPCCNWALLIRPGELVQELLFAAGRATAVRAASKFRIVGVGHVEVPRTGPAYCQAFVDLILGAGRRASGNVLDGCHGERRQPLEQRRRWRRGRTANPVRRSLVSATGFVATVRASPSAVRKFFVLASHQCFVAVAFGSEPLVQTAMPPAPWME